MSAGGDTTTTQTSEPWGPTQSYLRAAMREGGNLFDQGGFSASPFGGDRVAGFGDNSQMAQMMMADRAMGGAPATEAASSTLTRMMDPSAMAERLEGVKQNALGSAIPAAVSQFAGSGMANSTMAMDTVGRAATEAVAPYEYDAYQTADTNALRAATMAPGIDAAGYMPAQMLGGVGAQQDAMSQAMIDADMARHYEGQTQEADNLTNYTNLLLGLGGQGGTMSQTTPGIGAGAALGSAGLGGLGAYGMMAANPATAGIALPAGLAAGLLGLF